MSNIVFFSRFFKKQIKCQNVVHSANLFKNDCAKMFAKKRSANLKVKQFTLF